MKDFLSLHDADAIAAESAPVERPGLMHVIAGTIGHPSATFREVFDRPVQSYAALLAGVGGIYWLLNLAIAWAGGNDLSLGLILGGIVVVGLPAGIAYLYALTILLDWSCDILGGNPVRRRIRMLLACAGIPGILALLLMGIPKVVVYGHGLFLPERAWATGDATLIWALWFGDACAFAWSMLLVIRGLKIMNGFTTTRAMGAALLPLAPVALLGGIFLVVIWGVMSFAPPAY